MRKLILITLVALTLCSCEQAPPTADQIDQRRQEQIQQQGSAEVGMPGITKFTEKKLVRLLYELRDNPNLINYAYLQSEYTGKLIYVGKCIGYGIPYATQFSNPQKYTQLYASGGGYSWGTMPQAEPNGLFMPASADGTWLMMIDPKDNAPKACYFEPKVVVLPFLLP